MQTVGTNGVPDADLIEAISYSSKNSYFRTEDFRRFLILYRHEGCYAEHPKKPPRPNTIITAIPDNLYRFALSQIHSSNMHVV